MKYRVTIEVLDTDPDYDVFTNRSITFEEKDLSYAMLYALVGSQIPRIESVLAKMVTACDEWEKFTPHDERIDAAIKNMVDKAKPVLEYWVESDRRLDELLASQREKK